MALPSPFDVLTGLDKMVVLRTFRPDKMVPAVQVRHILHSMGNLPSHFLQTIDSDNT
jgi:dynein heavy chain